MYRVCQDKVGEKSENTAYKQQVQILTTKGVPNLNPRKQWCIDLEETIINWIRQGLVLLLCNANSDLLDGDLSNFLSNTGPYNISAVRHGLTHPDTYIRGSKCLDYRFGSIKFVEPLVASR
eukprot:13142454-Ditylum_brightwellii.AAC.1